MLYFLFITKLCKCYEFTMWLRGIEDNVSVALPPFFFLWNVPESSRGQVILTCCHCFTCSQLPACENLKFSLVQFPASFEQCCNEIKTTLSGWYLMKTDWWWEPRYLHWIVFERTKRTRCTLLYWVFQTCSMFLCFIKHIWYDFQRKRLLKISQCHSHCILASEICRVSVCHWLGCN